MESGGPDHLMYTEMRMEKDAAQGRFDRFVTQDWTWTRTGHPLRGLSVRPIVFFLG
jgi:hypothetical protein